MVILEVSKCCKDFDIDPLDLLFPERMTEDGIEFMQAHGALEESIEDLLVGAQVLDNGFIKIQHKCNKLNENGLCSIYANRPKICRDFDCSKRSDCACKGKGICQISQS
jgi:Fe-S-cluster containining protein